MRLARSEAAQALVRLRQHVGMRLALCLCRQCGPGDTWARRHPKPARTATQPAQAAAALEADAVVCELLGNEAAALQAVAHVARHAVRWAA